jgi:hypothetical protein
MASPVLIVVVFARHKMIQAAKWYRKVADQGGISGRSRELSNFRTAAGERDADDLMQACRRRLGGAMNQHQDLAATASTLAESALHLVGDWLEQVAHHGATSGL